MVKANRLITIIQVNNDFVSNPRSPLLPLKVIIILIWIEVFLTFLYSIFAQVIKTLD